MKKCAAVLASVLLVLAAFACKGDEKVASVVKFEHAKFDQPAAPLPPALDDSCDICTTEPSVVGLQTWRYFTKCHYITHYIYFPTSDTGAPYQCWMSNNEYQYILDGVYDYLEWQRWIGDLTYSSSGNYCRVPDDCGEDHTFYRLIPFTTGCGMSPNLRVYVSSTDYDSIIAAGDAMTCVQCFIRSKCGFSQ